MERRWSTLGKVIKETDNKTEVYQRGSWGETVAEAPEVPMLESKEEVAGLADVVLMMESKRRWLGWRTGWLEAWFWRSTRSRGLWKIPPSALRSQWTIWKCRRIAEQLQSRSLALRYDPKRAELFQRRFPPSSFRTVPVPDGPSRSFRTGDVTGHVQPYDSDPSYGPRTTVFSFAQLNLSTIWALYLSTFWIFEENLST